MTCLHAQESVPVLHERIEKLTEALERIRQWTEAYPLDIFPEPDWRRAREVLKAHSMTIDAISAGVMRRALIQVNKIVSEALDENPAGTC